LIVNWYDSVITNDATINLAEHGISLSQFDNCIVTDLWTGAKIIGMGGDFAFSTKDLPLHGHKAYKINCSAF
jgi:hypothetical protein